MGMTFIIRDPDTNQITGVTTTADSVPGVDNPSYIPWHSFPVSPAFDSMDEVESRLMDSEYMGKILVGTTFSEPSTPAPVYDNGVQVAAFRNRFTRAEKLDFYTKADTDARLRLFIDEFEYLSLVDITDSDIVSDINYLAEIGSIDSARVNTILAQAQIN